jgi:hypothetical protein
MKDEALRSERKMAEMQQQQQGGIDGDWVNMMDEESKKSSGFFTMKPTDQKYIVTLTDPEKGTSTFGQNAAQGQAQPAQQPQAQQNQKPPRTVFRIKVHEGQAPGQWNPEELMWEVGNRTVMAQIVASVRQFGLKTIKGAVWMVKTSGTDNKNRAWFLMLMSAPGVQNPGFASAPASTPMDKGQSWLEGQKVEAK